MLRNKYYIVWFLIVLTAGCQASPVRKSNPVTGSRRDMAQAIGQVADAITGQELSSEQKRKLTKDIQTNQETQSALDVIAGAMDIKKVSINYCPVDGQRFAPAVKDCPVHNVKLEQLTD